MAVPKKKKSTSFTKIHRYSWLQIIKKKRNNFLIYDNNFYKNSLSSSYLLKEKYISFTHKL